MSKIKINHFSGEISRDFSLKTGLPMYSNPHLNEDLTRRSAIFVSKWCIIPCKAPHLDIG